MNKYLVLGSSGQIGNHLVSFLKERKHTVLEFDILNDPSQDLRNNNNALEELVQESDFVMFLAFDVGGSKYLHKHQDSYKFIDNNIRIMSNTFSILKKHSKPFIFASSQLADLHSSTYGLCKAIGEKYTNSLGALSVKLWNVYGCEEGSEKSHVITDFVLKANRDNEIVMLTDGSEERQFLHVEDCCECFYTLSQEYRRLDKDKKYHASSFEWTSIMDVAKEVSKNFDDVKIIPSSGKDHVHCGWRVEPDEYILNFWTPKISLSEGIKNITKELLREKNE